MGDLYQPHTKYETYEVMNLIFCIMAAPTAGL